MNKRILFCTAYLDGKHYDYFGSLAPENLFLRLTMKRRSSYGLRFIRENIPGIEILEYPSWKKYKKAIEKGNYDIVGFSFYLNEVDKIKEMVELARENGVAQVWAGNYGALTPEVSSWFDKIFIGYAEREIAAELDIEINEIKHPRIITHMGTKFGLYLSKIGVLQTIRGCPMPCHFCQSPSFAPKPEAIPIESIDEVLRFYASQGVENVVITDESFGLLKEHTEQVIELLAKYNLHWFPMIRADILLKKLDEWQAKGLFGAQIGVESFSQKNLDEVDKKSSLDCITTLLEKAKEKNIFMIGYYIIGFEHDRAESIVEDLEKYAQYELDIHQITIMTPLPATPLWKTIEQKYGIFDKDYKRYNTKHLVWNHPHIEPDQMHELLDSCIKKVYNAKSFFRSLGKFGKMAPSKTIFHTISGLFYTIFSANFSYYINRDHENIF